MKTAVSIPDHVYQNAEKLAERLGKSRSQLYAQAIAAYIATHQKEGITEKLNDVYANNASHLDREVHKMQVMSMPKEEW